MTNQSSARTLSTQATPESSDLSEELLARACKAAADPLRLKVLRVLRAESFGVLELCHVLDLAQPKISHHLKVLANAGLVATRREGNSIFYRRPLLATEGPLSSFIQSLFHSIDRLPLERKLLLQIEKIKAERSRSSLDFFTKNADKFREKQALITENSQYVANMRELVKLTALPQSATAIEIGPGEGDYLMELAQQFDRVIAIDNSNNMLALAQGQATEAKLENIRFLLGEPGEAVNQGCKGDLLVCNMVLHHIPSPASVFQHAAKLLNRGGYMIVAELCHHDQEWVKDSCGDIWLGFEPEELQHWSEAASLELCQSLFLGLRNGFQVQLHLFKSING